jgi:REP element-mobilizing transposase RayT
MPDEPAAYFITFSTYGARLHGDARGTSDRTHNLPGTPLLAFDERRWEAERALMKAQPFTLDRPCRETVERAIRDAADFQGWQLHALSVRTNHVHVVISATEKPDLVMTRLKGRATRLLHEAQLAELSQPIWGEHGSTRWLWNEGSLLGAVEYVTGAQGVALDAADREPVPESARPGNPDVGLCFDCRHSCVVSSGRGSRFWLCELSKFDLGFPKYPGLPVLQCRGYVEGPMPGDT